MKTGIPLLAVSWSASHWIRHLPQKLLLTWQWCGECLEGECGSNAFFLDLVHTHSPPSFSTRRQTSDTTPPSHDGRVITLLGNLQVTLMLGRVSGGLRPTPARHISLRPHLGGGG